MANGFNGNPQTAAHQTGTGIQVPHVQPTPVPNATASGFFPLPPANTALGTTMPLASFNSIMGGGMFPFGVHGPFPSQTTAQQGNQFNPNWNYRYSNIVRFNPVPLSQANFSRASESGNAQGQSAACNNLLLFDNVGQQSTTDTAAKEVVKKAEISSDNTEEMIALKVSSLITTSLLKNAISR